MLTRQITQEPIAGAQGRLLFLQLCKGVGFPRPFCIVSEASKLKILSRLSRYIFVYRSVAVLSKEYWVAMLGVDKFVRCLDDARVAVRGQIFAG